MLTSIPYNTRNHTCSHKRHNVSFSNVRKHIPSGTFVYWANTTQYPSHALQLKLNDNTHTYIPASRNDLFHWPVKGLLHVDASHFYVQTFSLRSYDWTNDEKTDGDRLSCVKMLRSCPRVQQHWPAVTEGEENGPGNRTTLEYSLLVSFSYSSTPLSVSLSLTCFHLRSFLSFHLFLLLFLPYLYLDSLHSLRNNSSTSFFYYPSS